ncbi:MAG: 4-oxalomesaconate tautomerase [Pseudomonadota bacterium]
MTQTGIPFLFMRGGSSRGPYMRRSDLPEDLGTLADVLVALVGSGHPLNIDGLGGGATVTTKVAMLSPSEDDEADIDYFFAQVSVEDRLVDYKPTCGNILVGVGPAAIEMGLVTPTGDETTVRIRAVNTGARVDCIVQTPGGVVSYDGAIAIDGVPGTSAPISLQFKETVGGVTGALFPSGNKTDVIDGTTVTCMDVAMPMVIARAEDLGLTGRETREEIDDNRALLDRIEAIRLEAGKRMGMGDVAASVTPKFGLLSAPSQGGAATVRYLTPWACHPTLAVTGSQCIAACLLSPGTVADGMLDAPDASPASVVMEHPMGQMEVMVDFERDGDDVTILSAGLVRTARKLASGTVFVPTSVWAGR